MQCKIACIAFSFPPPAPTERAGQSTLSTTFHCSSTADRRSVPASPCKLLFGMEMDLAARASHGKIKDSNENGPFGALADKRLIALTTVGTSPPRSCGTSTRACARCGRCADAPASTCPCGSEGFLDWYAFIRDPMRALWALINAPCKYSKGPAPPGGGALEGVGARTASNKSPKSCWCKWPLRCGRPPCAARATTCGWADLSPEGKGGTPRPCWCCPLPTVGCNVQYNS